MNPARQDDLIRIIPPELLEGWQDIVNGLAELMGVPAVTIWRIRGAESEVFSSQYRGSQYIPRG